MKDEYTLDLRFECLSIVNSLLEQDLITEKWYNSLYLEIDETASLKRLLEYRRDLRVMTSNFPGTKVK